MSENNGYAVQSPPIQMAIKHNGETFIPCVEDGVQIETDRHGSAGKMTFTTMAVKSFLEGDPVAFYYDGKCIFKGYVFTKKRNKSLPKITVTAYDQLRYLKNKFSYVFVNKKASDIVKSLCEDFNLEVGTIEDSKYVVEAIAEENKAAIDIIMTATQETLANTGQMFVLYDDAGKVCYRNVLNLKVNTILDKDTAQDLDYQTSIDEETYNRVVLYYKPKSNSGSSATFSSMDSSFGGSMSESASANMQKVFSVAEAQLGNGYSKYSSNGSAWCADFVSWVFRNSGLRSLLTQTASCWAMAKGFSNQGRFVGGTTGIQPGDIVFFDWGKTKQGRSIDNINEFLSHVGIVKKNNGDGTITTIEGNTSGSKVAIRQRPLDRSIYGYGRPAY